MARVPEAGSQVEDMHGTALGSKLGSRPFPKMVRDFHRVVGLEARALSARSWCCASSSKTYGSVRGEVLGYLFL